MIKIKNLSFQYSGADSIALNKIDLEIPDNQYVAIVGHNGSGKSTLSKILSGIYKPTEGSVIIDDIIISKKNLKKIRKKIGIVFQNPDNQFIGSSVADDIAFGLENLQLPNAEIVKKVKYFAKLVKMEKFLEWEPKKLSGGQKQKIAIASVLALDPKIIIFDEITSMLDPKGKLEVINIIKQIKLKKNKILISITHDMEEAILADNIFVFAEGKLIASGNPKKILANKEIIKKAKLDIPFIYKISKFLVKKGIKETYDEKNLIEQLCK